MKKILSIIATSLLWVSSAEAGVPLIQEQGNSRYTIQLDSISMTIDANGGKILSFRYGNQEAISQLKWPNAFGSTFWTSPQKEWYWPPIPEYDKLPYTVKQENSSLVMTSQISPTQQYQITKQFSADPTDDAVIVSYTITNKSPRTRQVAPWEITRVINDGNGLIFFDADLSGITPAGLMNFKAADGAVWYQPDVADQNRKINADGKGWLAYYNHGLLLLKKFQDLDVSQPAPEEAEIQVYVNRGKTYIELESQGAYTTLEPDQSLTWTVRWYLRRVNGDPTLPLLLEAVK